MAPGDNTMKKFGRNDSHCTLRVLVSRTVRFSPPIA
jgi:hypothetical protein